jgi:uncharacterized membrane protein YdbT with pleckstrin-like domain
MGIRVVPTETIPKPVYRILLPHERRVITVRFHPAAVVVSLVVAFGGLGAAAVLSLRGLSAHALEIAWSICVIVFLYGMLRTLAWFTSYFVVTSHRIILTKGFFRSDVAILPLSAATRLRFRRSVLGRLLGYGQFIIQDAGGGRGQLRVNLLPYPEQLYIEVLALVFPDREPGD